MDIGPISTNKIQNKTKYKPLNIVRKCLKLKIMGVAKI